MQGMVRTRIAPSPTGYPHIGTIYQALFNYAFAKKHGGFFIVRIEDTDRARFVEGSEDVIFSALDWFGLTEDESARKGGDSGPYRQSERLEIYHKYAQELFDRFRGSRPARGLFYTSECLTGEPTTESLHEQPGVKRSDHDRDQPSQTFHDGSIHKLSHLQSIAREEDKRKNGEAQLQT